MNLMIDDVVYAYDEIFSSFGKITSMPGRVITRHHLLDNSIEALIIRSRTKVNAELLDGTAVSFVGSTVAGLDHIDLDYLTQHNIKFTHASGSNANAVVEYVITALVNLASVHKFDLANKTLGIVGVGNVGYRLANKAKSMGIKVLLNDPIRQEAEDLPDFVDLKTVLQADIISFHTPITKTGKHPSFHLLNKDNAHLVKADAIVINAARGGVIDEAVWQKMSTFNVIDCWENEPNINKNLEKTAYWATPHIAGYSVDAKFMGSYMIYTQLCDFLAIKVDENVRNLLKLQTKTLNTKTLKDTLNAVYDFTKDRACLQEVQTFEDYRRYYPKRYEWCNFKHSLFE